MAGGGKHKLEYVQQATPKFLRDFKARANFKEGPTVETKRQKLDNKNDESDDEREEKEDEKPVICVLKKGDLTEEEYDQLKGEKDDSSTMADLSERVVFQKPVKKPENEKHDKGATTSKNVKSKKKIKEGKKLDNKKLLSFGEDDE